MRRRRTRMALALTAALLAVSTIAAAQPRHHPRDRHQDGGPERLIAEHAEELGLDEATQGSIEAIVERTRKESGKLRSAHRQAAGTLAKLLELDEPDLDSVLNQADVVGELESQRRKLRLRGMLEIRALLTPAQREKLVEIRDPKHRERGKKMQACRPDAMRLCHGAHRPRLVLQCLSEHREELSQECGDSFDSVVEEMTERRGGRPPWAE